MVRIELSLVVACTLWLGACGGSSSGGSSAAGGSSNAGSSPSGIRACLQKAGYGVTEVPTADVTDGGAESRGPDQTAELLVGLHGAQPHVGADDAVAVIAFLDSAAHASGSPNARDPSPTSHADTLGSVTVQPTTQLASAAAASSSSPSGQQSAFRAAVKKVESCVVH